MIDWKKVIQIVRKECPRDIVLSVECGTVEQAERSIKHLKPLLKLFLSFDWLLPVLQAIEAGLLHPA